MNITLIGMGPGHESLLTQAATHAIKRADCIIGAERLLGSLDTLVLSSKAPKHVMTRPDAIAKFLKSAPYQRPCVLLTGDTGLYSGAKGLLEALPGDQLTVIPGISSVQLLSARLHTPWQDWHIASAHGQPLNVLAEVIAHPAVCLLTDNVYTPQVICQTLTDAGLGDIDVIVGENLSYASERIVRGRAAQLAEQVFSPLCLVLCIHAPLHDGLPAVQGLPDSAFLRGSVPMTKREVRAVSLCKLALMADDVVYDIGAGTGSVAVEAALRTTRGRVYAVEMNMEGCALIRQNAEKFHVHNLQVICGTAPDALAELPAPDAVFIGGSQGAMQGIIDAILQKNDSARFVANVVTLEGMAALLSAAASCALIDVEIVQMSIAKSSARGGYHLMTAHNPVFVFSARGGRNR